MKDPQFPPAGAKLPKVVNAEAVAASADAEAKRLAQTPRWRRSYSSAARMAPLLVVGPIGSKRNYYIVEFRSAGLSTGRMIFNASDGALGHTAGLRPGQAALNRFAMPAELPPLVENYEVTFDDKTTIRLNPAVLSVDVNLVWTSCDQSHSPLQPFYVVRQTKRVVFVRVDAKVYPRLTLTAAGA